MSLMQVQSRTFSKVIFFPAYTLLVLLFLFDSSRLFQQNLYFENNTNQSNDKIDQSISIYGSYIDTTAFSFLPMIHLVSSQTVQEKIQSLSMWFCYNRELHVEVFDFPGLTHLIVRRGSGK